MRDSLYLKIFKILIKKVIPALLVILFQTALLSGAIIRQQVKFAPNNLSTWFWNTGVYNQDLRVNNTPGLEWPIGSGKFTIFTAGLSIGAYVNGQLRMANASYSGEFAPGYVADSSGNLMFKTNAKYKLYSVRYNDTKYNNPDVELWKNAVLLGAPFTDNNYNGIYEVGIDKPGMPDATQTVFICLTDADASNHTTSEGFSGGTTPLYSEIHITAWGYDSGLLNNLHFIQWDIINKNKTAWEKTYFAIFNDPDLGDADDDYIGCDSAMQIAYSYNSDNQDGTGQGRSYGANPPATGLILLRGPVSKTGISNDSIRMSSLCYFLGSVAPVCEQDPSSAPIQAYNFMRGVKKDGTPWLNPTTVPPFITKFCYNGDPETAEGWTEYKGKIENCGGILFGNVVPSPPGDRRFILNAGSDFLRVNPGETQRIVIAQAVERGTDNKNSVTKLKETLNLSRRVYYQVIENQETYYIEPPPPLPQTYKLYQNYPNPFNPVTTIKYDMKKLWKVKIEVYDMRGEIISTLVNEEKPQGSYEVKFDASNLPSGIYFIKMISGGGFEDSKKMVVIK